MMSVYLIRKLMGHSIQFYIMSMKISHRDLSVIRKLADQINNTFKNKNQSLSVTEEKIHDYLGISIDYNRKDCVTFTMYDYLEDILKDSMPYI